jgi:hypothetical protein
MYLTDENTDENNLNWMADAMQDISAALQTEALDEDGHPVDLNIADCLMEIAKAINNLARAINHRD